MKKKSKDKQINIVYDVMDPTKGGMQNSAYYLYKELSKSHPMYGTSRSVPKEFELDGVEYSLDKYDGHSFLAKTVSMQINNSRKSKCATNLCLSWPFAAGALISKKIFGTPYICLAHGLDIQPWTFKKSSLSFPSFLTNSFLRRKVLKNADVICTNSNYTKGLFNSNYQNDDIVVIHPGVHFEELDTCWKKKKTINIFSLGRHVKRKGFANSIKAMAEIRKECPNIKYILAGTGPETENLKKIARELKVDDIVVFTGPLSEEEKFQYFRDSDLFLMPTYYEESENSIEGFGIVYIEANMAGRFVIAADSGGCGDAVKEGITGHLLADAKPQTIAKDTVEIIKNIDKYYTQEIIDARVDWAKQHSFENIAKQYEQVMFNYSPDLKFWD